MPRPIVFAALALLAAGCTAAALSGSGPATPAPIGVFPGLSAQRGFDIAERRCAGCHAIGSLGLSPTGMAPPFRALRVRYNPINMERHIAQLAARGYFGMPAQPLTVDEARDVAAYIETLREP